MNQTEEYDARIISGAAELFRIYGIRAVTMDMIASHLGISKRTIYERFNDKDALLYAVIDSMIDRQREKLGELLVSSPNVISAIFSLINIGRDHTALSNPLMESDLKKYHSAVLSRVMEKCENPNYEGAAKILSKGIEQGHFRDDINIDIVSRTFAALGKVSHDQNIFPPERFVERELTKNIMINYLRGISTA
ncbi:MAG: TetR/AcrR family transcriptional regulator, partial [Bacteroidales bacterium]|nr:TetR/AcrR family transcriptional regulator [Bacteroidales bacterium]